MMQSFIAQQGQTLYDLCIKAYGDMRGLPYLLGDNPILQLHEEGGVTGVKCIGSNNEYLSSPAGGSMFPSSILDIDIEFTLIGGVTGFLTPVIWKGEYGSTAPISSLKLTFTGSNKLEWVVRYVDGVNQGSTYIHFEDFSNNNIAFKGVGIDLEISVDGLVVATYPTISTDISNINDQVLYFHGYDLYSSFSDLTLSYVRIGTHEWLSPNWTSPTTTNSQGVVTTLHSDVSTAAMIQGGTTTTPINSKQRYDVTVQQ